MSSRTCDYCGYVCHGCEHDNPHVCPRCDDAGVVSASEGGTAGNGGTATSEGRALRDEPVPSSVDAPKTSMICWYADDYEKDERERRHRACGVKDCACPCHRPVHDASDDLEWRLVQAYRKAGFYQPTEVARITLEVLAADKSTDDAHLHGLHRVERFGDGTYRCLTCESQDKASEAQS